MYKGMQTVMKLSLGLACIMLAAGTSQASEVHCNYTFTDCYGVLVNVQWTCANGSCCPIYSWGTNADGERCIISLMTGCCQGLPPDPGNP